MCPHMLNDSWNGSLTLTIEICCRRRLDDHLQKQMSRVLWENVVGQDQGNNNDDFRVIKQILNFFQLLLLIFRFVYYIRTENGQANNKLFQKLIKSMEGQLKIENGFNLLQDQSEDDRNIGCWSIDQNLLYSIFIDHNKLIMISKKKRKRCRIFDQMANFINSRNSLQCRSHHQKLIQKLGEIKTIISAFKKHVGKQYYRQQYNMFIGRNSKRNLIESNKTIKNEENTLLEYNPPQINEPSSLNLSESQEPQPQPPIQQNFIAQQVHKNKTVLPECKAQQPVQYYYPYNYYIDSSILQFPFIGGYYAFPPITQN